MSQNEPSVVELQARWDKIRTANLYDTLDKLGYSNQCLDLGIRSLFHNQHLAGQAITIRSNSIAATPNDAEGDWVGTSFDELRKSLYPGCVVVIDSGGEEHAGKFGEMTSWALKQGGAHGIVIDSYIRDSRGLEIIPGWTACVRGTSPIESNKRWRMTGVNVPIGMPGTLTSRVRVAPGDWIVGGMDGVIVVPQEIAMEALVAAEELEVREQGMREDMAAGLTFDESYAKWGRA